MLGGVTAGALGLAWMWRSGCWSSFWEIFLTWNRDYAAFSHRPDLLIDCWLTYLLPYLPWSIAPLVALFLAPVTVRRELHDRVEADGRPGAALLAAFFLGWFVQAAFLQLPHDYAVAPVTLPALALLAAVWRPPARVSGAGKVFWMGRRRRRPFCGASPFAWNGSTYGCAAAGRGRRPKSRACSPRTDSPYGVDAVHLARVADYLRGQKVGDGELTCLSGCTHPLYLDLDVKPSTRFPQVEMATLFFVHHRDEILAELNASRQRFIVSDLTWTGLTAQEAEETNPNDPLALPREFPEEIPALLYPWDEPVVFRSGRYLVHRVTRPASRFWRLNPVYASDGRNDYAEIYSADLSFRDEEAARRSVAVIDDLYKRSERTGDPAGA